MISPSVRLAFNIFLINILTAQLFSNLLVVITYLRNRHLHKHLGLILLINLALIDAIYAIFQLPYIIIITLKWNGSGKHYHHDPIILLIIGGIPGALIKAGGIMLCCIGFDRFLALCSPIFYFKLMKNRKLYRRWLLTGCFLSYAFAALDLTIIFALSSMKKNETCNSFDCFVSQGARTYWGTSNTITQFFACLFVLPVAIRLHTMDKNAIYNRFQLDKRITKASVYILVQTALFGVLPSCINAIDGMVDMKALNLIGFYITICASFCGLFHALILMWTHSSIRRSVLSILHAKNVAPNNVNVSTTVELANVHRRKSLGHIINDIALLKSRKS